MAELNPMEIRYYEVFLDFLQAVGDYLHVFKMEENLEDGNYIVQKVAYEYNYTNGRIYTTIMERDNDRWKKLDNLSYWSKMVGLGRIREEDKEKVMRFVEDKTRRQYLRDNIRRAMRKGELWSIANLMRKRYALEKKRAKKEGDDKTTNGA